MKTPPTSRLLAMVAMLAFAAVSFSALAGWPAPLPQPTLSGAPEPTLLLLIGLALTAAGLLVRGGARHG